MKGNGSFTIVWLCIAVTFGTTCQKAQDPEPNYTCEGILYDKPLNNIRACVAGEWKMLECAGGIANSKEETPDTYLTVRNDSLFFTSPSSPFIASKITWEKLNNYSFYGDTYLLEYTYMDLTIPAWIVVRLRSDTLTLNSFGSDAFGCDLIRIK